LSRTTFDQIPHIENKRLESFGFDFQNSLEQLADGFGVALQLQLGYDGVVFRDGVLLHALLLEQVGDLDSTCCIRRIDGRHFLKQPQRFLLLARLPIGLSRRFQATNGLQGQTHALIEI